MPEIAIFSQLVATFFLLIAIFSNLNLRQSLSSSASNQVKNNLEPDKSESEIKKNILNHDLSSFWLAISFVISALAIIFLSRNQHFWVLVVVLLFAIIAGFFGRFAFNKFLETSPNTFSFLVSLSQLTLVCTTFFFAENLGIEIDGRISLANRIAIDFAAPFACCCMIGSFLVLKNSANSGVFEKIYKIFLQVFLIGSNKNYQSSKAVNESSNQVNKNLKPNSKSLGFLKNINFSLILLICSVLGFGFFASQLLFFLVLFFSIRISIRIFLGLKLKNNNSQNSQNFDSSQVFLQNNHHDLRSGSNAAEIFSYFCLAISISAIGFILANPLIIAVGSVFFAFFGFVEIENESDKKFSVLSLIAEICSSFLSKTANPFK